MRIQRSAAVLPALISVLLLSASCRSGMGGTNFLNPKFNFAFVERVAVLPFENHSTDRLAGPRATRLTITELLSTGAIDVVEPGEVEAAVTRFPAWTTSRPRLPSTEEVIALGKALGVQALLIGAVTQSELVRSGSISYPVVTLDLHLVEVETGAAVWASTRSVRGSSVAARMIGIGGEPIAETTRECIRKAIRGLVR